MKESINKRQKTKIFSHQETLNNTPHLKKKIARFLVYIDFLLIIIDHPYVLLFLKMERKKKAITRRVEELFYIA